MLMCLPPFSWFALLLLLKSAQATAPYYGADVSFPMQHNQSSTKEGPLGDRESVYKEFYQGCLARYGKKGDRCFLNEKDRIEMSLRQPQSMVNYTKMGFQKIRAPPELWELLQQFWQDNKDSWREHVESWPAGNTYTNHWKAPTHLVSVEEKTLRGGGSRLKNKLWAAAKETLQEWTGQELTECSLYGIRVYTRGAMLSPHVDRLPLVSSAIVNVAQNVDEAWPLEVIGHDGRAHNVTMDPGDMVLYESHAILHGRPFALQGDFFANVFIHFEPTGHSLRHHNLEFDQFDANREYREAFKRRQGGHEAAQDLPPYVLDDTPEAANYRASHPGGYMAAKYNVEVKYTDAHIAAVHGNYEELKRILDSKQHVVHAQDENGFTPLQEGVRSGNIEVVKLLYEKGANLNYRTNGGVGGTALYYAERVLGKDHPVSLFLAGVGAVSIEPEL